MGTPRDCVLQRVTCMGDFSQAMASLPSVFGQEHPFKLCKILAQFVQNEPSDGNELFSSFKPYPSYFNEVRKMNARPGRLELPTYWFEELTQCLSNMFQISILLLHNNLEQNFSPKTRLIFPTKSILCKPSNPICANPSFPILERDGFHLSHTMSLRLTKRCRPILMILQFRRRSS